MVVVNLYPFKETVANPNVTDDDAIENIDIGGPTCYVQQLRTINNNSSSLLIIMKS